MIKGDARESLWAKNLQLSIVIFSFFCDLLMSSFTSARF